MYMYRTTLHVDVIKAFSITPTTQTYHIQFILKLFDSFSSLPNFFLIPTSGDIEVVERERPERGIEFGRDVLPDFGGVELAGSFNYRVQHGVPSSVVARLQWRGKTLASKCSTDAFMDWTPPTCTQVCVYTPPLDCWP